MAVIPYMPLYIADYMADAAHLSTLEHGAYMLLIMAYWQRKKALPASDERLANIAKLPFESWQEIRDSIAEFFSESDGLWSHKRIDAELSKFQVKSEKAKAAASASVEARLSVRSTDAQRPLNERSANAKRTFNHTDTDTDTGKSKSSPKPPSGAGPQKVPTLYELTVQEKAERIHTRHPAKRRDISVSAVAKKLEAICKKLVAEQRIPKLEEIDENHELRCASYDWTKEDSEYAKSLDAWLAPTKGRFDAKPVSTQKPSPTLFDGRKEMFDLPNS